MWFCLGLGKKGQYVRIGTGHRVGVGPRFESQYGQFTTLKLKCNKKNSDNILL